MSELAIIGGTGLTDLSGLEITDKQVVQTPFGTPSAPLIHGTFYGKSITFLARHGSGHTLPPHKINYQANIWALKEAGVKNIVAVAAVGAIPLVMQAKDLVIPHQLIDYTWGRTSTFFEDQLTHVTHIDFTHPYCEYLRNLLLQASAKVDFSVHNKGIYAATQGPRLESAAEIDRLERDGCDIVGMTGMPEAALAREQDLCYATCAVVANQAAGRGAEEITMDEIYANLQAGIANVKTLLGEVIKLM